MRNVSAATSPPQGQRATGWPLSVDVVACRPKAGTLDGVRAVSQLARAAAVPRLEARAKRGAGTHFSDPFEIRSSGSGVSPRDDDGGGSGSGRAIICLRGRILSEGGQRVAAALDIASNRDLT